MKDTRTHAVTIKFTSDEFDMLRAGAEYEKTAQSEYLRGCLLRDRLAEHDPIAMKIAKARLAGLFRGHEEVIEGYMDHMLEPVRQLKIEMDVAGMKKSGKKK